MPIDTYNPPSAQAIENAIKPAYQLEEERIKRESTIDIHEFDAPDTDLLTRMASDKALASLASMANHETHPRPATAEVRTFNLEDIAQATHNIATKRAEYIAAAQAGRHSLATQRDYALGA